jgi:hypothetical protein
MTVNGVITYAQDGKTAGYILASDAAARRIAFDENGKTVESLCQEEMLHTKFSFGKETLVTGQGEFNLPYKYHDIKTPWQTLDGLFDGIAPGKRYADNLFLRESMLSILIAKREPETIELYELSYVPLSSKENYRAWRRHLILKGEKQEEAFCTVNAYGDRANFHIDRSDLTRADAAGLLEALVREYLKEENNRIELWSVGFDGIRPLDRESDRRQFKRRERKARAPPQAI